MTCEAHLATILHHIHRSRNNYWLGIGIGQMIFEGSVIVYDGKTQLLIKNPTDRHLQHADAAAPEEECGRIVDALYSEKVARHRPGSELGCRPRRA